MNDMANLRSEMMLGKAQGSSLGIPSSLQHDILVEDVKMFISHRNLFLYTLNKYKIN